MQNKPAKKLKWRKLFTSLFGGIFIFLVLWINYKNISLKRNLKKGDKLPIITYRSNLGMKNINIDSTQNTVIIIFDEECDFCEILLKEINENIDSNIRSNFYFFNILEKKETVPFPYPKIEKSPNTYIGYINSRIAFDSLDIKATPTTFIINPDTILVNKIKGAVKYSFIDRAINNSGN